MSIDEIESIKNKYRSILKKYSYTINNSSSKAQIEQLNKDLIVYENKIFDYKINI